MVPHWLAVRLPHVPGTALAIQMALSLAVFALFMAKLVGVLEVSIAVNPAEAHLGSLLSPRLGGASLVPALVASTEFQVLLIAGFSLAVLLPLLNPLQASALTLLAMLPVVYLGYSVPRPASLVPMEYSLLTFLVLFGVKVLTSYFIETHSKQQILARFGQYVPPQLVKTLSEDPRGFSMDGEARQMTVLFADIRDFTPMAEKLDPRQLVQLLNAVFTPLTEVAQRRLGTIDKYIGDAVMVFWGAPLADPDHAHHGVMTALEMQRVLARLRAEFPERGWPEVHMGIGLNTGTMSVGNMGSRFRIAYTVIGDAVNLAARLQALTREIRVDVVVTEATRQAAPDVAYRELGTVRVKGKQHGLSVYEPIALKATLTDAQREWLDEHADALGAFYARRWDEATTRFGRLWGKHPDDRLYEIYLNNLLQFTKGPTPTDWDGELDLEAPVRFGGGKSGETTQKLRRVTL